MVSSAKSTIVQLPELVAGLPPEEKALFQRIFSISTAIGTLDPPPAMHPWIEKSFGSVEGVLRQRIIKVTNLITSEGALFNELRSQRPMEAKVSTDVRDEIERTRGCPFCRPLEETPADSFGRIQGKYSITASNIAKYDGFHGLVIFHEHDPLKFGREEVHDYLEVGLNWARRAHQENPEAKYFLFMWNCLWKAGASIIHGHAQVALPTDSPYSKVEALRETIERYRREYGTEYLEDLWRIHRALGLAFEIKGVRFLAYLTPVKEKEVMVIAPEWGEDLKDAIYTALRVFVERLGVVSFNLALAMPPLVPDGRDWSGFPIVTRLVDRGDPANRTADVAAMEFYAQSVIASDPFAVARALSLQG